MDRMAAHKEAPAGRILPAEGDHRSQWFYGLGDSDRAHRTPVPSRTQPWRAVPDLRGGMRSLGLVVRPRGLPRALRGATCRAPDRRLPGRHAGRRRGFPRDFALALHVLRGHESRSMRRKQFAYQGAHRWLRPYARSRVVGDRRRPWQLQGNRSPLCKTTETRRVQPLCGYSRRRVSIVQLAGCDMRAGRRCRLGRCSRIRDGALRPSAARGDVASACCVYAPSRMSACLNAYSVAGAE